MRAALLLLLALATAPLAGCCSSDFKIADMRGRALEKPLDTLDVFRTAVRFEDWDEAYRCVSAATVDLIHRTNPSIFSDQTAFAHAFARAELQDLNPHIEAALAHVRVVQVIHRASIRNFERDKTRDRWYAWLRYDTLDEAIPIVHEKGDKGESVWKIGIAEWLEERSAQQ